MRPEEVTKLRDGKMRGPRDFQKWRKYQQMKLQKSRQRYRAKPGETNVSASKWKKYVEEKEGLKEWELNDEFSNMENTCNLTFFVLCFSFLMGNIIFVKMQWYQWYGL